MTHPNSTTRAVGKRPSDSAAPGAVVPSAPLLLVPPEVRERFREFYLRMYARARAFAERFASRVEAEDAVHDAMTDVWVSWVRRGPEAISDHLFLGIVRNKVIDQRRTSERMVSLEDVEQPLQATGFGPSPIAMRGESREEILDLAIARLPRQRRHVFLLAQEDEYTYEEVAWVMKLSIGTVKTHLRLAMADVRAAFKAAGHAPPDPRMGRLRTMTPVEERLARGDA